MRFTVITLFPEVIDAYCASSILGRAQKNGLLNVVCINPRQFTHDIHHKVDDTPYGGGPGMVMLCDPIIQAYQHAANAHPVDKTLLLTPSGIPFRQPLAQQWSAFRHVVLICGHYEGIDARVEQLIPNCTPLSIGDYVLTGGELAALCVVDAMGRLQPGVLGQSSSVSEESFSPETQGLLEYPQYTRPAVYNNLAVPDILLSGHHQQIAAWRKQEALKRTQVYRPDLLQADTLPRTEDV